MDVNGRAANGLCRVSLAVSSSCRRRLRRTNDDHSIRQIFELFKIHQGSSATQINVFTSTALTHNSVCGDGVTSSDDAL